MTIIDNVLHARALQEFGRGYLSPTRTDSVLVIIFERIDKAEAHAKQLARELELMHDIAISHSGRVEELTKELTTLNDTLLENGEAAS